MILNISSTSGLVFFIFLIVPALLGYKSYFYGRGGYAFLNKSNIEAIQGVSVMFILIQSAIHKVSQPDILLKMIATVGDIAMALFLFFLGYQLVTLSLTHRKRIRKMLLRKIASLALVMVSGQVFLGIVLTYLGEQIHLQEIVKSSLIFQFVDGTSVPLIATILYFYVAILMSHNLGYLTITSLLFLGICWTQGWPLILGFYVLAGGVLAQYPRYAFLILKKNWLNLSLVLGIFIMICLIFKLTSIIPFIGIIGVLIILMKVQFKSRLFILINRFALSLYVLHLPVLYLLFYSSEPRNSVYLILVLVISLILVIIVKALLTISFMPKKSVVSF